MSLITTCIALLIFIALRKHIEKRVNNLPNSWTAKDLKDKNRRYYKYFVIGTFFSSSILVVGIVYFVFKFF